MVALWAAIYLQQGRRRSGRGRQARNLLQPTAGGTANGGGVQETGTILIRHCLSARSLRTASNQLRPAHDMRRCFSGRRRAGTLTDRDSRPNAEFAERASVKQVREGGGASAPHQNTGRVGSVASRMDWGWKVASIGTPPETIKTSESLDAWNNSTHTRVVMSPHSRSQTANENTTPPSPSARRPSSVSASATSRMRRSSSFSSSSAAATESCHPSVPFSRLFAALAALSRVHFAADPPAAAAVLGDGVLRVLEVRARRGVERAGAAALDGWLGVEGKGFAGAGAGRSVRS
jgi:hypothetical protein